MTVRLSDLTAADRRALLAELAAAQQHRADDVDNSPWDAGKAWANGAAADDPAAFYAGICAGKKAGDPATQAAHALPHHYHPGDAPNADGVRNSLSRLPTTKGLTNEAAAKSHLEAHMSVINPDYETQAAAAPSDVRAARAEALESRSSLPGGHAARMEPFRATFRREMAVVNGKELAQLDGYASITGIAYEMWDMFGPFTETIDPGAFDVTLAAAPDVAFLLNHRGMTMARTTNGTLILDADPRGLHSLAYVNPARSDVADMLTAIDDELITEMSFAFMITEGGWNDDYDEFTILSVDIDRGDVSAVNYGANPYTSIAARSREILADLMKLPDGAQRHALAALERRFGAAPVPGQPPAAGRFAARSEHGRPDDEIDAETAAAARAQLDPDAVPTLGVERLARKVGANGGRPVSMLERLISIDD